MAPGLDPKSLGELSMYWIYIPNYPNFWSLFVKDSQAPTWNMVNVSFLNSYIDSQVKWIWAQTFWNWMRFMKFNHMNICCTFLKNMGKFIPWFELMDSLLNLTKHSYVWMETKMIQKMVMIKCRTLRIGKHTEYIDKLFSAFSFILEKL